MQEEENKASSSIGSDGNATEHFSNEMTKEEASKYFDSQFKKFIKDEWLSLIDFFILDETEAYNIMIDHIDKYLLFDTSFDDVLKEISDNLKSKILEPHPTSCIDRAKMARDHFKTFFEKLHVLNREA